MFKSFFCEINSISPLQLGEIFYQEPYFMWFDTNASYCNLWPENTARFSFLAFNPVEIIIENDSSVLEKFHYINNILKNFVVENNPHLPPWQGGIAGYLSYEVNELLESVPISSSYIKSPKAILNVYDPIIAFDHMKNKTWIIATGYPATDESERQTLANQRIQYVLSKISQGNCQKTIRNEHIAIHNIQSSVNKENYIKNIQEVIRYIYNGDIFQANLSRQIHAHIDKKSSKLALYKYLREINPAPFSCYFQNDSLAILSSSPERFLSVSENKNVSTRPIKGTRKRILNHLEEDLILKNNLMNSAKDKAENLMIVDLMRNDLSKSCLPHTIKVEALWQLETYATVHQLTSIVSGVLDSQHTAFDLLLRCFPGGSITGAPKVRAMEIIAGLEKYERGPYCGSIGYLGFNGTMDFNIAIRTIVVNKDRLAFNVGGGIVSDSNPQDEYEETEVKANALIQTLKEFT